MPKYKTPEKGGHAKTIFTKEDTAEVEKLAAGMNVDQIAEYFGMSSNTFRDIRVRQPEVEKAFRRGKAKTINMVSNKFLEACMDGCATRQIFYLKTQAGWREREALEIDIEADKPKLIVSFASEAEKG